MFRIVCVRILEILFIVVLFANFFVNLFLLNLLQSSRAVAVTNDGDTFTSGCDRTCVNLIVSKINFATRTRTLSSLLFGFWFCFVFDYSSAVTLSGVVADDRFDLPPPPFEQFGKFGLDDRVLCAVLLGCDTNVGGVNGVTPKVIAQHSKNLRSLIPVGEHQSISIAMAALKYMPVEEDGKLKYSSSTPTSLPAMLAEFAIDDTIPIDTVDEDEHPKCVCDRLYYEHLSLGDWRTCDDCRQWLCYNCSSVHVCGETHTLEQRVRLFDNEVDRDVLPAVSLPPTRSLPSESLVPIKVQPALVKYASVEMQRAFLYAQVRLFCFY
jgi:hypothetical protein